MFGKWKKRVKVWLILGLDCLIGWRTPTAGQNRPNIAWAARWFGTASAISKLSHIFERFLEQAVAPHFSVKRLVVNVRLFGS